MEGMVVNAMGGDDYVVIDDLLAAATVNLGDGNDRVQVGQVFKSERVKDPARTALITGIRPEVDPSPPWRSRAAGCPTA